MKRQVWADEEVKTSVNSQFIPVAIDVDNPDDAAVLARYNIGGAPVTIITDPQGNALRWRVGGSVNLNSSNCLGRGIHPLQRTCDAKRQGSRLTTKVSTNNCVNRSGESGGN